MYPENLDLRKFLITLYTQNLDPVQAVKHLQAIVHYDPGFASEAAITCKELLSMYPGTPDVLLGLAKILIHLEHYSEGVACTRNVFEQDPQNSAIRPILEEIISKYPEQMMALHLIVECDIATHQFEWALANIQKILQLNPAQEVIPVESLLKKIVAESPSFASQAQLQLTHFLLNQKSWIRAATEAKRLFHTDQDQEARLLNIKILRELQRQKEAFDSAQEALELYPFDRHIHEQLRSIHRDFTHAQKTEFSEQNSAHWLPIAHLYVRQNEWVKAITTLQKIVNTHPDYLMAQFTLTYCFFQMGRFDLSIQQLTRLLGEIGPSIENSNQIRYLLGISYIHLSMPVEALAHIEKIVEFDIAFPHLESTLKWCQDQGMNPQTKTVSALLTPYTQTLTPLLMRADSTISCTQNASNMTLSFSHSHNNQGVDHMIRGQLNAAEESLQMAVQLDPDFEAAQLNLGVLYLLTGNLTQAEYWLKKQNHPSDYHTLFTLNLGVLKRLNGSENEDIETLIKVNQTWKNPIISLYLGDFYAHQLNIEKALFYWHECSQAGWTYFHIIRRLHYLLPLDLSQTPDWVIQFSPTFKISNFSSA
jgi:tetratricopeptide (TPR) repeat protein